MEENIALITSGFVFMRFIELAVVSYILFSVLRRDPKAARVKARNRMVHDRARTPHSDKD